jgi:hypothetical protein
MNGIPFREFFSETLNLVQAFSPDFAREEIM